MQVSCINIRLRPTLTHLFTDQSQSTMLIYLLQIKSDFVAWSCGTLLSTPPQGTTTPCSKVRFFKLTQMMLVAEFLLQLFCILLNAVLRYYFNGSFQCHHVLYQNGCLSILCFIKRVCLKRCISTILISYSLLTASNQPILTGRQLPYVQSCLFRKIDRLDTCCF